MTTNQYPNPESWLLWQDLFKPVKEVYDTFPAIKEALLLEDVVDYATEKAYPKTVSNEMNKVSLFKYAKTIAFRYCLKIKTMLLKEHGAISIYYDDIIAPEHTDFEVIENKTIKSLETLTGEELLELIRPVLKIEEYMIIRDHYYLGKTIQKIAQFYGFNENTAKSHFERGKKKLEKYFKENNMSYKI